MSTPGSGMSTVTILGAMRIPWRYAQRSSRIWFGFARFCDPKLNAARSSLELMSNLALGPPAGLPPDPGLRAPIARGELADVLVSCEAKTVMTEHGKSQPRIYDELSSSHEIVHQGRPDAIATGITIVNSAETFVSPLRQTSRKKLHVSRHRQPEVAARMVQRLRGLPIREGAGQVGFDAYATIVVDCDNQGEVRLWTAPPAPQPGEPDHYETFLDRISRLYAERFSVLPAPR